MIKIITINQSDKYNFFYTSLLCDLPDGLFLRSRIVRKASRMSPKKIRSAVGIKTQITVFLNIGESASNSPVETSSVLEI